MSNRDTYRSLCKWISLAAALDPVTAMLCYRLDKSLRWLHWTHSRMMTPMGHHICHRSVNHIGQVFLDSNFLLNICIWIYFISALIPISKYYIIIESLLKVVFCTKKKHKNYKNFVIAVYLPTNVGIVFFLNIGTLLPCPWYFADYWT